jgi:hypothetical protein
MWRTACGVGRGVAGFAAGCGPRGSVCVGKSAGDEHPGNRTNVWQVVAKLAVTLACIGLPSSGWAPEI